MIGIFYEDVLVARVKADGSGLSLDYEPDWTRRRNAFPISMTMPMGTSHGDDRLLPWLANLLPESHLPAIGQALGVSPADVIGMLKGVGRDTAGAFSIGQAREVGDRLKVVETEGDLERILDELPSKPFLVGEDGVSMSLAGVQEKLPVCVVGDRVAIPLHGTPSTHILKPDSNRLKGSVPERGLLPDTLKPLRPGNSRGHDRAGRLPNVPAGHPIRPGPDAPGHLSGASGGLGAGPGRLPEGQVRVRGYGRAYRPRTGADVRGGVPRRLPWGQVEPA